jgi:hypothetical protein
MNRALLWSFISLLVTVSFSAIGYSLTILIPSILYGWID